MDTREFTQEEFSRYELQREKDRLSKKTTIIEQALEHLNQVNVRPHCLHRQLDKTNKELRKIEILLMEDEIRKKQIILDRMKTREGM